MVQSFVSRRDTQERWQSALKRADAKNVRLFKIESTGTYIATSGTTTTVAYQTDGVSCECAAAVHGDPVCIHRAKFWQAMGMLELDAPQTRPCSFCRGEGEIWSEGSWNPDTCFYCRGTGQVDGVIDRIGPNNVIEFSRIDSPRPAA